MRCAECEQLRAQLAKAQAEVAAWEAYHHPPSVERMARWRDGLGASPQIVAVIMAIADAKGRIVPRDQVVETTRGLPNAHADDPHRTLANVVIHKARKHLDTLGLGGAIETIWGLGYLMSDGARQRILALVGEDG
jgi:DNA-binding response OmpR family regulator